MLAPTKQTALYCQHEDIINGFRGKPLVALEYGLVEGLQDPTADKDLQNVYDNGTQFIFQQIIKHCISQKIYRSVIGVQLEATWNKDAKTA